VGLIIISACLAGLPCRYDGRSCAEPAVVRLLEQGRALPVCPEQLGGLPTPREPAEIQGGTGTEVLDGKAKVVNRCGEDLTSPFVRGAEAAAYLARKVNAHYAVLVDGSPSCGVTYVYDGTFSSRAIPGMGVTAAALSRTGIRVLTPDQLPFA